MTLKLANYTGLGLTLTDPSGNTKTLQCGGFRNAVKIDSPASGSYSVISTNWISGGTVPMIAKQTFTVPSSITDATILIGVVPNGAFIPVTDFDQSNSNIYFVNCFEGGAIAGVKPGLTEATISSDDSYKMVGLAASNIDASTIVKNQKSIWSKISDNLTSGSSWLYLVIILFFAIIFIAVVIFVIYYIYKKKKSNE